MARRSGSERVVGSSFANVAQAAACLHVFGDLSGDVLVICMYRPMAKMLQSILDQCGRVDIRVGTVDAAQGAEADHVLVACVRSNEAQQVGFCNDLRRLNVALSRAKKSLTIIGDTNTMTSPLWRRVRAAAAVRPVEIRQDSRTFRQSLAAAKLL